MVVVEIAGQDPFQMTIVQHDDAIQTISPDTTDQSFGIRIRGLRGAVSTSLMPMLWTRLWKVSP